MRSSVLSLPSLFGPATRPSDAPGSMFTVESKRLRQPVLVVFTPAFTDVVGCGIGHLSSLPWGVRPMREPPARDISRMTEFSPIGGRSAAQG